MRRAAAAPLALLLLAPLLGGCARKADSFKPRIVVTSPDGGGVGQARAFTIRGYALDDRGVERITVDGKAIPTEKGSRKIANFAYQTRVQGNKATYLIGALDAAGNKSVLEVPITVDGKPPVLKVTRFERSGTLIRVTGVATDDNRVTEVLVDGKRLNITSGTRVDFYAETTGVYADVEAVDSAGNRTRLRAQQ
ncbi:hypothetical protein L1280_000471 [Deinococcus sp. HSC-46F16]|uniref:hypothetical protein n=1 Tax=Deinococcus sp. HSC-46F16 TaxID=2910968 RepID=UPI0020A1E5B5|nr:hypothetical protein [Deinococcus sp. HSC-46F16]MCP2013343.1 hypothetical protein [Deinococcus sp. HSC-46F16]